MEHRAPSGLGLALGAVASGLLAGTVLVACGAWFTLSAWDRPGSDSPLAVLALSAGVLAFVLGPASAARRRRHRGWWAAVLLAAVPLVAVALLVVRPHGRLGY
jgi:hypothetical protein